MKSLIAVMAIVVSANSFAYSVGYSTVTTYQVGVGTSLVTAASLLSSSGEDLYGRKVSERIIQDSQEMMQTGEATPFLSQMIKETQDIFTEASEEESLGILVTRAEEILSK